MTLQLDPPHGMMFFSDSFLRSFQMALQSYHDSLEHQGYNRREKNSLKGGAMVNPAGLTCDNRRCGPSIPPFFSHDCSKTDEARLAAHHFAPLLTRAEPLSCDIEFLISFRRATSGAPRSRSCTLPSALRQTLGTPLPLKAIHLCF